MKANLEWSFTEECLIRGNTEDDVIGQRLISADHLEFTAAISFNSSYSSSRTTLIGPFDIPGRDSESPIFESIIISGGQSRS